MSDDLTEVSYVTIYVLTEVMWVPPQMIAASHLRRTRHPVLDGPGVQRVQASEAPATGPQELARRYIGWIVCRGREGGVAEEAGMGIEKSARAPQGRLIGACAGSVDPGRRNTPIGGQAKRFAGLEMFSVILVAREHD